MQCKLGDTSKKQKCLYDSWNSTKQLESVFKQLKKEPLFWGDFVPQTPPSFSVLQNLNFPISINFDIDSYENEIVSWIVSWMWAIEHGLESSMLSFILNVCFKYVPKQMVPSSIFQNFPGEGLTEPLPRPLPRFFMPLNQVFKLKWAPNSIKKAWIATLSAKKLLLLGDSVPQTPFNTTMFYSSAKLNYFQTTIMQYRLFHECGQLNIVSNVAFYFKCLPEIICIN